MFDYLIVGAGFAGSVLAERLARGLGTLRISMCSSTSRALPSGGITSLEDLKSSATLRSRGFGANKFRIT